jgi:hypothetical protein
MRKEIKQLQDAIRAMHGSASHHVRSAPVREVFNGQITWIGIVEVFDLLNHPKAKRCYAWSFKDGEETKTVVVLEIPPVDSAETAVKVAIAAKG